MNIDIEKKQDLTSYRKIAIASWRHPRNPNIYTMLDLPVDPALAFLRATSSKTPLTLTHYVTKIIAHCLNKHPELNHVLRMGNLYKRKHVDIYVTTLLRGRKGKEVSGFVIRNVNNRSIEEIGAICKSKTADLRQNRDLDNLKVQQLASPISPLILRLLMIIQEFLQFTLNISIPFLGMPKDRFGSAMVTDLSSLGIENAFIPLSPYSRCPLLIAIGKPRKIPIVQNDRVIVANSVIITITIDHRYADGSHGSLIMRHFKKIFADPFTHSKVFQGDPFQQPLEG
jgi:hypothetical protein